MAVTNFNRRSVLKTIAKLSAYPFLSPSASTLFGKTNSISSPSQAAFKRIAVEEAFATPELFDEWRELIVNGNFPEPGFYKLYEPLLTSSETQKLRDQLLDVGSGRIKDMDQYGIDLQILSITAPGVQVFDKNKAIAMAEQSNDKLAEFIRAYPNRYAGLAAIAPQSPKNAAKELERAVTKLGMKGAIINSHTQGEYLDQQKYWDIFEAAQALDVPIYLHPRTPSPKMIEPFMSYGLEGAGWGFAIETSTHAMRLILSGLFDRFPRLKMILGHMGEGIPFWLPRIDSHFANKNWNKMMIADQAKPIQKKPSEYFKSNFFVATSGVNWKPALTFALSVLGAERILFAIDYPYESTAKAVAEINDIPISMLDKQKIYQLNAEKLFKLK